jgi:hypothetical protein
LIAVAIPSACSIGRALAITTARLLRRLADLIDAQVPVVPDQRAADVERRLRQQVDAAAMRVLQGPAGRYPQASTGK